MEPSEGRRRRAASPNAAKELPPWHLPPASPATPGPIGGSRTEDVESAHDNSRATTVHGKRPCRYRDFEGALEGRGRPREQLPGTDYARNAGKADELTQFRSARCEVEKSRCAAAIDWHRSRTAQAGSRGSAISRIEKVLSTIPPISNLLRDPSSGFSAGRAREIDRSRVWCRASDAIPTLDSRRYTSFSATPRWMLPRHREPLWQIPRALRRSCQRARGIDPSRVARPRGG